MADISKIKLPSGTVYNIKDEYARAQLVGVMAFIAGGSSLVLYSGTSGTTAVPLTGTGAFADGNTTARRIKLPAATKIRGVDYAKDAVYAFHTGDTIIVNSKEYVATVSGGADASASGSTITWSEFGDNTSLGALAYKDSASGSYTPAGSVSLDVSAATVGAYAVKPAASVDAMLATTPATYTPEGSVSQPTFSGTQATITVKGTPSGSVAASSSTNRTAAVSSTTVSASAPATYTPGGTVSQPTFSGSELTSTGNFTPSGSVSSSFTGSNTTFSGSYTPAGGVTTATTENKTAAVSPAGSGTVTYTPAGTVALADSDATESKTVVVSGGSGTATYTPAGTIALSQVEDMDPEITAGEVEVAAPDDGETATYTPAGTVSTPTISVKTAGTTTTIKNPTSVTVVKSVAAAEPAASDATGEVKFYAVDGETLVLKKFTNTTGASITTSNVTVKTGDAAYQSTQPTFTGTGVMMRYSWIDIFQNFSAVAAVFTGTPTRLTGSVTVPKAWKFTGTGVRLVTGNIAVPKTYTFSGTAATISVSGTPNGSVTSTFTGSEGSVSVKGTPAGTVSQPTFSGTPARLVTGNISVPTAWTFSGSELTSTGSYTPGGTVSKPTFTGTGVRLLVDNKTTNIVTSVTNPTFTGTAATITVS